MYLVPDLLVGKSWPFQFDRIDWCDRGGNSILWNDGEPFVAAPEIFKINNGIVLAQPNTNGSHSTDL